MATGTLTKVELDEFRGTEEHHRGLWGAFMLTDGVKYMAERGEAYWLIDDIAAHVKTNGRLRAASFQLWRLVVDEAKRSAVLTCVEDIGLPPLVTQEYRHTDFPLPQIEMYLEGGVLMLPSER